ncbi:hypothetical protein NHX12_031187 [Muraenolepis orangiensis]|uniref:Protein tweety homolog n=1 Tax=Muraenolepis orangiensis TaxID=630683 RepID=A0A9Q0E4S8_9TELE|nr:hypothetical protein NHX12_031187 [Muraenolepis orangiensis]
MSFVLLSMVLGWASLGLGAATAVGTSDFCVSPDKFIVNQTKDFLSADVAHYYLFCSPNLPSPFQQSLTIYQRSLTTMQIQIQGLLRFSVPLFPTAERDLLGIQRLLNSTESNLQQLTAFLDCHRLSLSALLCAVFRAWKLVGIRDRDYDDIDEEDPFNPQARRLSYNPGRSNVHSFCSYNSSLASEGSLRPPPAPLTTASNANAAAPPAEYM